METLQEKIKRCISKHPDWKDCRVANSVRGANSAAVKDARRGAAVVTGAPKTKVPLVTDSGLDGFRKKFSKSVIARRRKETQHDKVNKAISDVLRKRKWIPDGEFRDMLGFSSADWANIRIDFEHLLITDLTDENRRKFTVWAHPDCIDELRAIANE